MNDDIGWAGDRRQGIRWAERAEFSDPHITQPRVGQRRRERRKRGSGRVELSGQIRATSRVERDGIAHFIAGAARVGGPKEIAQCVEPSEEDVKTAERTRHDRAERAAVGHAADRRVAGTVHRDTAPIIVIAAAGVRRPEEVPAGAELGNEHVLIARARNGE